MKISKLVISISLTLVFVSCTNHNDDRIKLLEDKISKLDSMAKLDSNNIEKSKKIEQPQTVPEKVSSEKKKLQNITDNSNKFIGSWKFYKRIPPAEDNSMNDIICVLERYPNTNKTFVFHLWDGHDLILSIKDGNTMVGQNANLSVKYDPHTDHLSLIFQNGDQDFYSRLE